LAFESWDALARALGGNTLVVSMRWRQSSSAFVRFVMVF
jgi:hypothetical protein